MAFTVYGTIRNKEISAISKKANETICKKIVKQGQSFNNKAKGKDKAPIQLTQEVRRQRQDEQWQ